MNKIQIRNLTILLGSTMTVMAGATLAPALPEIHLAFQDVPNVDFLVRLVVTLPALLIAIAAPFTGYLLDHWGRKPVLIVAMALYGVAGTSGYLLDSLYGILIGRAFLGVAVAGVMIGFTTLIADYFNGNQLNKFMGSQAAFIGFGGVVFVTAGGFLADIGWRFPFLVHLFAFVVLLGVLLTIDEPHIQDSSTSQSTSGEQTSYSLKNVALIYGIGIIAMVVFFMVPVQLPFYLTDLIDASTSQIGLALAAQTLSAAIVSTQYQKIKARFSFQTISSLVFLTLGAGYFIIGMSATYVLVLLGLLISGIGLGLLLPNLNVWVVSVIPPATRGRAVGGLTTFIFLGQFLSPIATQPVAQQIGLAGAYVVGAGTMLLLALVLYGGGVLMKRAKATTSQASVME